jgi:sugar phosphate isomerase/epimerase
MATAISLAHLTVPGMAPVDMIETAARAGYTHVGLRFTPVTPGGWAFPLMNDRSAMREVRRRLDGTGVRVLDIELVRLAPETDVRAYLPMLEAAAQLGARHVLTQAHDPDFGRVLDRYIAFCDLAVRFGLTADLEFLPWTKMSDLETAARVVASAGRPNAGVLIDTLHFFRAGSDLIFLEALPREWFHYVQLADAPKEAPTTVEGLIHAAREDRLLPGDGDLDLRAVLARIPPHTPIALEIPNAALAAVMDVESRVRAAADRLRALLDDEACGAC